MSLSPAWQAVADVLGEYSRNRPSDVEPSTTGSTRVTPLRPIGPAGLAVACRAGTHAQELEPAVGTRADVIGAKKDEAARATNSAASGETYVQGQCIPSRGSRQ